MKAGIVFIMLMLYLPVHGHSSQLSLAGYTIYDGLSQSVVTTIYQDSRGYIWLGTQNGLNRFDGYSFVVFTYRPDDPCSISNNWIYGITEDREGNLWIGTKGGLNKYVRGENCFERIRYSTPYYPGITEYVYDVRCSRNGNIFINTPPVLTICNPANMSFEHLLSPLDYDGSVKDYNIPLLEDDEGAIWIGSTRGLAIYSPESGLFHIPGSDSDIMAGSPDKNITALWQDSNGDIWAGTSAGLNRLTRSGQKEDSFYSSSSKELPAIQGFIRAIAADLNGNLWIGTEGGGLHRVIKDVDGKYEIASFLTENSGLYHNIILSVMADRSENLWIGTLSGVNKADLKKQKFHLYRKSDSPNSVDLAGNVIASLYKDETGLVWIGTWGQGLNIYDRQTGSVEHYSTTYTGSNYLPNDYVHVIFEDSLQNIWIGTRDGLLLYERQTRRFVRPDQYGQNPGIPDFSGLRIFSMIQGGKGDYWIATQDGLFKIRTGQTLPDRYHAGAPDGQRISSNLVYSVLEDSKGNIWVATSEGLDIIEPGKLKIKRFRQSKEGNNSTSDDYITALCEDYKGDIWIGTSSYVNKFSIKDSSFVYFSDKHGLPGNLVYDIIEDSNYNLWFSTGNGLCRMDHITLIFRAYNVDDGLQSQEFNIGAAFMAEDGEIFFGGMNGFNSFYPDSLTINPYIPGIVISTIYKLKRGIREYLNPDEDNRIVLKHNEYSLTVEFAALEFTNPSRNKYMYKLEGFDDEWVEIGNRNFLAFSNLSPGKYTLRVKGSNNDEIWSDNEAVLNVIIRPPWWRSNTAWASYFLSAGLLILLVFRGREQKYLRDRMMLEEKVRERTARIEEQKAEILEKNRELKELNSSKDKFFSIIAHDLRNPFNYISGISGLLLTDFHSDGPRNLEKALHNIKDSSEQAHELLENLLLWARSHTGTLAFNPQDTDIKMLTEECVSLVKKQADRKGIAINVENTENVMISVDANMIRTILRNLLVNALKFTCPGGHVTVGLCIEDFTCKLRVMDTGIGMGEEKIATLFNIDAIHKTKGTSQEQGSGLGLVLCRELAERHGGRIEVYSEKGKGSEFRVVLPVT